MKHYDEHQLTKMEKDVVAIGELILASQEILDEEKEDKPIKADSNVIAVDFGILSEFERIKSTPLKLPQVLAVYHDWAERTYKLCKKNRGRLRSGKLRRHIELCLGLVATISHLSPPEGTPEDPDNPPFNPLDFG